MRTQGKTPFLTLVGGTGFTPPKARTAAPEPDAEIIATAVAGATSDQDQELIDATADLPLVKAALDELYRKFGDNYQDTEDYEVLEERRRDHIDTLSTVPATSWRGIAAKASAIKYPDIEEDDGATNDIGQSMADDILTLIAGTGRRRIRQRREKSPRQVCPIIRQKRLSNGRFLHPGACATN
jgi:hypothetical protein